MAHIQAVLVQRLLQRVDLGQMVSKLRRELRVQSLHIIPGVEFDELRGTVGKWADAPSPFKRITLGAPLLNSIDDIRRSLKAVLATVEGQRAASPAVVTLGGRGPGCSSATRRSKTAWAGVGPVGNRLAGNQSAVTEVGKMGIEAFSSRRARAAAALVR